MKRRRRRRRAQHPPIEPLAQPELPRRHRIWFDRARRWFLPVVGLGFTAMGTKYALFGGEVGERGRPSVWHAPDPIGWFIAVLGLVFTGVAIWNMPPPED